MKRIIALDGGTTNTRLTLMSDGTIGDRVKLSVGARDGRAALANALSAAIPELLSANGMQENDIEVIAVSGMATSELGLYNVPHIVTPVGKAELTNSSLTVELPEICSIPFIFIPGVKTFADNTAALSEMDIMRGEETETVAILDIMGLSQGDVTLILPGSHMKIVNCKDGRITSFATAMSGELTRAAAENTILKNSIGDAFTKDVDREYLRLGYDTADKLGMGAALFKLRVAGNFKGADKLQLYSALLGIILHDDVELISKTAIGTVAVGGSNPFRAAYLELLRGKVKTLTEVPGHLAENAAAYGAWTVTV